MTEYSFYVSDELDSPDVIYYQAVDNKFRTVSKEFVLSDQTVLLAKIDKLTDEVERLKKAIPSKTSESEKDFPVSLKNPTAFVEN